jgi:hypothetical protein
MTLVVLTVVTISVACWVERSASMVILPVVVVVRLAPALEPDCGRWGAASIFII